ncbi:hypothetical protein [Legionella septentrionalis]|uniref:hypothetical protein n=1 Tax=Legionella septentrionalis TaxID=2498109 RepID=UPI000F8D117B|nr:hypothetical protein [Legionella septentrionalis]RUR11414.1 hypothetical protein ELY14_01295 [Legionella septentrionalis]
MEYLIATEPDDTDAVLVKLALEESGETVRLLFTADHPTKQKNSVYVTPDSYCWKSSDAQASFVQNQYDVVWWRRVRKPYLPTGAVHVADHKFVLRENVLFHESMLYNLAPDAWWVNPKEAATRANAKLYQLQKAIQCGLLIPKTLCSNDPDDIEHFIAGHEDSVIYKPLCAHFWSDEKSIKIAYTAKIHGRDFPDKELLQLSPGIYQKEVQKAYELRIVCFGDHVVAAKLNSQEHPEGKMDWRAIPEGKLKVEPYLLPASVEHKIKKFMQSMRLVFGSLDFIVTPEGEYVFLEVNEQGQFLWLEAYCPELPMLDMFIHFLMQKTRNFRWVPPQHRRMISSYHEEVAKIVDENMQYHVYLNGL